MLPEQQVIPELTWITLLLFLPPASLPSSLSIHSFSRLIPMALNETSLRISVRQVVK